MRLVLEAGSIDPARGAATAARWYLGGSGGAESRLLSTLSPRRQKFRPRRPLESRYKFVTERPRMLQRAERTCQDPYHGTQPYPASGTRVGTLWTPTEVGTAHLPGLGGVWPMSTFAI